MAPESADTASPAMADDQRRDLELPPGWPSTAASGRVTSMPVSYTHLTLPTN